MFVTLVHTCCNKTESSPPTNSKHKERAADQVQTLAPSHEVQEDLVVHDAGHLGHAGLGDGSPLGCRHQHLTCDHKQTVQTKENRKSFNKQLTPSSVAKSNKSLKLKVAKG